MTKLLTEQELSAELVAIVSYARKNNLSIVRRIMPLIQAQKIAHADMVISIDDSVHKSDFHGRRYDVIVRNNLRDEQRERNR